MSSTVTFVNTCPIPPLPMQEYTITDDAFTFAIPMLDVNACPLFFIYNIEGPAASAITDFKGGDAFLQSGDTLAANKAVHRELLAVLKSVRGLARSLPLARKRIKD